MMSNRLASSSSLYLRQHAGNPIHWQEWGEAAFAQAKAQNKPVFLSVGYAACHWCHVMAHESFEDIEVAELLNREFVSIKVDREERPDVDEISMTAVQVANGHGGWPMTLFLTPDQEPFFAGTYFPRHQRGETPGFLTLCGSVASAWRNDQPNVREAAAEFVAGLRQVLERTIPPIQAGIDEALIVGAVAAIAERFDPVWGGFGIRPKFPPHTSISFLLDAFGSSILASEPQLKAEAQTIIVHTLNQMVQGGIHDMVGGGFHRYSTDQEWHLPHFEKMLSDNALLLGQLVRANKLMASEQFSLASDRIVGWIEREMTSNDGLFFNSMDADVEGEEGVSYVWSFDEVADVVGPNLALEMGALPEGNFAEESTGRLTGANILSGGIRPGWTEPLGRLFTQRNLRPQPTVDRRSLAGANGLMISGLILAGRIDLAERAAGVWLALSNQFVPHQITDGVPEGLGFLDDHASLGLAFLDLAESTGAAKWGEAAERLANQMVDMFADGAGGFFSSSSRHERLLGRTKPCLDQAVPSGNGLALRLLRRLGREDEVLLHLGSCLGWVQRMSTSSETLLSECLAVLEQRGGQVETTSIRKVSELKVSLDSSEVVLAADGWAYAELTVSIPYGYHINSQEPPATWLIPTTIEVEGVYGEAAFPDGDRLEGEVIFQIRLKPRSARTTEFELKLSAQMCNDRECLALQTHRLAGVVVVPGG